MRSARTGIIIHPDTTPDAIIAARRHEKTQMSRLLGRVPAASPTISTTSVYTTPAVMIRVRRFGAVEISATVTLWHLRSGRASIDRQNSQRSAPEYRDAIVNQIGQSTKKRCTLGPNFGQIGA
jgi:hypothetical protein